MEEQMEEWVTTQNSHKEKINWVDEWIKKFWYVYTMEYYSALKKNIWVSPNEADEPKACYTEWSKSEREKQIPYFKTYMWNLKKKKNGTNGPICRTVIKTQT